MYELLYIVPAPFTEKDLDGISKKIKEIIKNSDGKITKQDYLGNKKLAYPIKQVHRGFYLLVNFEIGPEKITKIDQKLKLTPEVLRHMIIQTTITTTERKPKRIKEKKPEGTIEKEKPIKEKTTADKKKVDIKKLGEKIDDLFKL